MQTAGLFDLQVNGFAGVDFNDARLTADALDHALEAMAATGVTACLPTVITATADDLAARFAALDEAAASSRLGAAMVPGYHLEGPFLNPAPGFRGCHPAQAMAAPDIGLVDALQRRLKRPILLVTLAPELPGGAAFVRAATARGIAVSIGHSDARPGSVAEAAAAGAALSTHLGNGLAHQIHKFDNPLLAQRAEDRLAACFFADGIHVPPHALKVLMRAKGFERCILVTDAVAAAAAAPGLHPFAGFAVERAQDGTVRLPGSATLAGSSLTLDQAVRNVAGWGICGFGTAVAMAGAHPRAALAAGARHHGIALAPGRVLWTGDGRVAGTVLAGGLRISGRAA